MIEQEEFYFGEKKYPGYKNYDVYLSNLYGNYMELPPEEKRKPHGDRGYRVEI